LRLLKKFDRNPQIFQKPMPESIGFFIACEQDWEASYLPPGADFLTGLHFFVTFCVDSWFNF
jgi:hypothetical protein